MCRRMLADDVLFACSKPDKLLEPALPPRKVLDALAARVRPAVFGAQRYRLAPETSGIASGLGAARRDDTGRDGWRDAWDDPELLIAAMPSSWPPFARTWIEYDLQARIRASAPPGTEPAPDTPPEAGMLVEQLDDSGAVMRMTPFSPARGPRPGMIDVGALSVVWDTRGPGRVPRDDEATIIFQGHDPAFLREETIALARLRHLLGATLANAQRDKETAAAVRHLADHAAITWSPYSGRFVREALTGAYDATGRVFLFDGHRVAPSVMARHHLDMALVEQSGDWRLALAVLALLNSRSDVLDVRLVRSSGRGGGGRTARPYHEHRVVSLAVPRQTAVARLIALAREESARRRRHAVEAHWCWGRIPGRTMGDPRCAHVWDEPGSRSMRCTRCGQKRWRRDAHERGDARIGVVTKDRTVTARNR